MSPPGSINGFPVDSFGESKKKKGPTPRQQEELCLVCGDRASGYHYNALTCEGCKGFFRRSITKNAVYQCKYGNNCEIDMYMRRKCQECRLKKCLNVGMRPECVVPEQQCAVKREAKRQQKEKDKPNSTTKEHGSPVDLHKEETKEKDPAMANKLSSEEAELIERLVYFQEEFESPSDDDLKKITQFPFTGQDVSDDDRRFKHITEITILTVQLIVEFAKCVPGFIPLKREDQITLLKTFPFTGEDGEKRPQLLEPKKVEKIQEIYLEALRKYVDNHRTKSVNMFARLLSVLTELRTLGNLNSEMCFSLKLSNKKLPPFLAEIWDIQC
uniref:Ecdysone receptor n=1 Tax=Strigamia maritima TaxID=126957 RepID=T1JD91_STRMM